MPHLDANIIGHTQKNHMVSSHIQTYRKDSANLYHDELKFRGCATTSNENRMIVVSKQNQNLANIIFKQSKEKEEEKHPFKSRHEEETMVHLESSHLPSTKHEPKKNCE